MRRSTSFLLRFLALLPFFFAQNLRSQVFETPPPGPVRTMAEWEELQALTIAWTGYPDILAEIVRAAREETEVIILCKNASTVTSCKNKLTSKGVDFSSRVTFLIGNYDSVWIRDYGPNSVYLNDVDSLVIVDWQYNRPTRPADDASPATIAAHLGLPVFSTSEAPADLVNTGGNFMSDGLGTAFASNLILQENDGSFGPSQTGVCTPKTEAEIDAIMADWMGLSRYVKMDELPYDGINHIDMHMKLLDEETLLISEYPTGVADGPQIEANIQFVLQNFKTSFGTDFKIRRILAPPDAQGQFPHQPGGDYRTYTNAVFVNKTVILPTYQQKYDTTALRIWREAMPGYRIFGIPCNDIITALGAIHCITKEVGASEPMWIVHKKLADFPDNSATGYEVVARIETRSGVKNAELFWTSDTLAGYSALPMSAIGQDSFAATIPMQPDGSEVFYYVAAEAESGKKGVRPMPAPAGFWKFRIGEPSVSVAEKPKTEGFLGEIFPNPAGAITCVPVFLNEKKRVSARLFDLAGRQILKIFEGDLEAGEQKLFFDAASVRSGAYFFELSDGQKSETQKVIVR